MRMQVMESGLFVGVAVVGGLLVWGAWYLASKAAIWAGLILPVGAIGVALAVTNMPVGHPEEAMGRGLVAIFVVLPLVAFTMVGALLGYAQRWRNRSRPTR
jgi:hypothetical protein